MIEKLKEMPELKLGLTIAGGIFVGLLAYRLFLSAYDWWQSLSTADPGQTSQPGVILCTLATMGAALCYYGIRAALASRKTPATSRQRGRWGVESLFVAALITAALFSVNAAGNPAFFPWLLSYAADAVFATPVVIAALMAIRPLAKQVAELRKERRKLKLSNYSESPHL